MVSGGAVKGWRRMASAQRGILLGGAVLIGFVVAVPMTSGAAAAPYSNARLRCRPTPGAVGSRSRPHTIIVVGDRFPGATAVELIFDHTKPVGSTRTTSGGSFTARVRVPATRPGRHTVTATTANGTVSATCRV